MACYGMLVPRFNGNSPTVDVDDDFDDDED
jgi:hypothetical protein